MKKKLIVKQDGYKECGISCLLSIIRYFGGNISINKLAELTHTNKKGTTFYNLKVAASKFGIESEAFKIYDKTIDNLKKIILPSICQIIDDNYEHFIVLYHVDNNYVIVMDPARGKRKIAISIFLEMWTGYVISFIRTKSIPYIEDKKFLNNIIISFFIKNKGIVLNIVFFSILFTITSSFYAMYGGMVIDYFLATSKNGLFIITVVFLIILIIKSILFYVRNKLLIYLNQRLDCTIFLSSFQKILLLPYSYYKSRTTGEVLTRINDLEYVKNMLSKIVLTLVLDLFVSFICAIILLRINVLMFILLLVTILIYIFIFLLFGPIIKKYTDINQENTAKINSLLIEIINGYGTIKNLNLESVMNEKMSSLYVKSLRAFSIYDNINNWELFFKDFITYIGLLFIEFVGFNYVFDNILTTGQIVIFISLVTYFITPIRDIIDLNKEYFYAINSLKRANNLMDIESVNLDMKTNFDIKGNIKINNLTYSYDDYTKILKDITLDINMGEKVLILGDSGSGKSTIIKLLAKYYGVNRDSIYLDDVDINDISVSNLRDNLTIILQDEVLFTDTIKNNIVIGRRIDDSEFSDVCKLLYIDQVVKDKYLGYNTKLEENGCNLSGGQRQRIILARALLKKGNIILIDEGLNAIDINLERKILKNIFDRYRNKTIIIVSHRLENMDLYDIVIELRNGYINSFKRKTQGAFYNV